MKNIMPVAKINIETWNKRNTRHGNALVDYLAFVNAQDDNEPHYNGDKVYTLRGKGQTAGNGSNVTSLDRDIKAVLANKLLVNTKKQKVLLMPDLLFHACKLGQRGAELPYAGNGDNLHLLAYVVDKDAKYDDFEIQQSDYYVARQVSKLVKDQAITLINQATVDGGTLSSDIAQLTRDLLTRLGA